jgi:hypothetical protein
MGLTKRARRVGGKGREGEISARQIERDVNGRSGWAVEKREGRVVVMI